MALAATLLARLFPLQLLLRQDPRVLEHLVEGQPVGRLVLEELSNEVLGAGGEVLGPVDVDFGDPGVGLVVGLGLERGFAGQKLVAQDAQGPKVHLLVVVIACKDGMSTLDLLKAQVSLRH